MRRAAGVALAGARLVAARVHVRRRAAVRRRSRVRGHRRRRAGVGVAERAQRDRHPPARPRPRDRGRAVRGDDRDPPRPLGLPGAELHRSADARSGHPEPAAVADQRQPVAPAQGRHPLRPPGAAHAGPAVADRCAIRSTSRGSSGRSTGRPQELLVLPRTEPVRWSTRRRARPLRQLGRPSAGEPLAAVDVDGLRPYRPGTPASRIHWPALARGAGLLERRLQSRRRHAPAGRSRRPRRRPAGAPRCRRPRRRVADPRAGPAIRGCVLLLPGDRRPITIEPDLVGWPGAHTRLALVEGGPGARAPMLDAGARLGAVFYVAARPVDRLPPVLTGRWAVAPRSSSCPTGFAAATAARPSFEVAGCRGYVIRSAARRARGAGRMSATSEAGERRSSRSCWSRPERARGAAAASGRPRASGRGVRLVAFSALGSTARSGGRRC